MKHKKDNAVEEVKDHAVSKSRIIAIAVCSVLGISVAIVLMGLWLYSGKSSEAKMSILRSLGLPLGRVGSEYILPRDLKAYERSGGQTSFSLLTDSLQLRAVAQGKVIITLQDIEDAATGLAQDPAYIKAVTEIGADAAKDTRVTEFVLDAKLRAWYAEHIEETPYRQKVLQIEKQLQSGVSFESLAKQYSDDTATKWFGGDAGYVDLESAIPEYRDQVREIRKGSSKTVYTRYGAHIVEVQEEVVQDEKTLVQLREIVITPKGYEEWLLKQKNDVQIHWYIE